MNLPFTLALGNTQIAVMGALAAFLIPAGGKANKGQALMDWEGVKRLPWDVIILFGGGLSLAAALRSTGLAVYLGGHLTFLTTLPLPILILILVAIVVFLTELTSNVATTTAFLPVMGALAAGAGVPPEQLVIPVAVAASCAFMLPVATAPNAIVYASGATSQGQMIRAGFRINLAAIGIITALGAWLGPIVFAG
jgi:sodium-dependent dicarboxylate transporter 2/3/5